MFWKSGADFRRNLRAGLFKCLLTLLEISFQSSWLMAFAAPYWLFFSSLPQLGWLCRAPHPGVGSEICCRDIAQRLVLLGFVLQAVHWDVGRQCWDSVSFTWSSDTAGGTSSSQLGQGWVSLVQSLKGTRDFSCYPWEDLNINLQNTTFFFCE